MTDATEFEELRPLLFSIAYRILGTVGDAEDAVQEAWVRYEKSGTRPASPKAFLATVVTRVSINELQSARRRREQYVGEWFPEPLLEDPYRDPERATELFESVSVAALLLLERLSPLERAVFVLREVFGFEYAEIAAIIERSEPASRQLAARARRHMGEGRSRFDADRHSHEQLTARLLTALDSGDMEGLRELMATDIQVSSDSGGKAPSLPKAVVGADKAVRLLISAWSQLTELGLAMEVHEVNGQPGVLFRDSAERVISVTMLDVFGGHIQSIRTVTNPDKLDHIGQVAEPWSVRDAYIAHKRQRR